MNKQTLVGTPDPDINRRARLEWVAAALRLPAARARQALARSGSLRGRRG